MTAPFVLAIDAGTTGVRALVFDRHSAVRGSAYEEVKVSYPRPGWVETDAEGIWSAVRRVVAAALGQAGASSVSGIGVATQRATTVLWDRRTGRPLHAAIVWQDLRTVARVDELLAQGVYINSMASGTKMEWLLEKTGSLGRATDGEVCLGTIDSWLAWRLTGGRVHVTDSSNASCTGFFNYVTGGWDPLALEALGLPTAALPSIVPTSGVVGTSDAAACGIEAPVAALSGDQQAAMFGQLRDRQGDLKITFGTSAMADINTGEMPVLPASGTYPLVLWGLGSTRVFCLEGTAITVGAAVQWLRDGLGIIERLEDSGPLASSTPDSGGVWAIPAFQGLGTPHMDPVARAVIGGMSRATTKAHLVRAVLEGVAFRCREVVQTLVEASATPTPEVLRVDGGAAANDFLMQQVANALGIVVERPVTVQATALGAAYLAGLAVGTWSSIDELRESWRLGARFEPQWSASERDERFEHWRGALALARQGATTRA